MTDAEHRLLKAIQERGYLVSAFPQRVAIGTVVHKFWDTQTEQRFVVIRETDKADWAEHLRACGFPPRSHPRDQFFYRITTD